MGKDMNAYVAKQVSEAIFNALLIIISINFHTIPLLISSGNGRYGKAFQHGINQKRVAL
jgi:hypothetical protein